MPASATAPVESQVEKKNVKVLETAPPALTVPKRRNLLEEIFAGHEEFLGLTPD